MSRHVASPALSVSHLTKDFGREASLVRAVKDVSFEVKPGEIVGLLGPNGAGKTTTLQMLLGLTTPTSGEISYFGLSLADHREEILTRINHTSAYARLPWKLKVRESLEVTAMLYNVADRASRIKDLIEVFQAQDIYQKTFSDLSAGQKTRIMLLKAFINHPELVLLDEPTASLDPDIASQIRSYILTQQEKYQTTILITSHNMREVEELCDRVVFLHHGQVLAVDTPEGLAKRSITCHLSLMVTDGLKRLVQWAEQNNYEYELEKRYVTLTLPEKNLAPVMNKLPELGVIYSEIEIAKPSLEDFFVQMSQGKLL